jgi:hypothetical protein
LKCIANRLTEGDKTAQRQNNATKTMIYTPERPFVLHKCRHSTTAFVNSTPKKTLRVKIVPFSFRQSDNN